MTVAPTVVYGCSDDLVELEGGIDDEVYANSDDERQLIFSTGVVLMVRYTDGGFWRIEQTAGLEVSIARCARDDPDNDDRDYSDRATVPDAEWVEWDDHDGNTWRIAAKNGSD